MMGRLNAEELRVLLKLDSKKQAFVDEKRRANAQTPLKGPMLGDIWQNASTLRRGVALQRQQFGGPDGV